MGSAQDSKQRYPIWITKKKVERKHTTSKLLEDVFVYVTSE